MKTIDFGINYDIVDEIVEPAGMKSRLIQNHKTKSYSIQTWASMSQAWVVTQRYQNVLEMWQRNKKMAESITKQKKVGKK